ncbi:MAG: class I SAM-dependent methyltransferase [Cyclobacteriaceae bacterium]|nr:class I SAM-dependent methyltransferase [Cyclobacteriaceae bacterium]
MQSLIDSMLSDEIQDFLLEHENGDVQKLLLKQDTVHNVPTEFIAQQLTGRKKAKVKFKTFYNTRGIAFPPSINLEQSSSEATAKFKLALLKSLYPDEEKIISAADLTGGFGVDTQFLSLRAQHIDYIEPDTSLYEIAKHNHKLLNSHNQNNITHYNASAEDYLDTLDEPMDLLFLDPSRRKKTQKIFKLADSEPNVVLLQKELLQKATHVLIKTSPLMDIQQGCRELENVSQVIIVAVDNECKELLFLLEKNFSGEPVIRIADLNHYGEILSDFSFSLEAERNAQISYSNPLTFLYEPSAATLKAGAFKWIGEKFNLKKLAPNSHLYTSSEPVDFPGRIFTILESLKLDKKINEKFPKGYANIITRNYPLSVEEIKAKTGLKEGGEEYLICTQGEKEKFVLLVERLK